MDADPFDPLAVRRVPERAEGSVRSAAGQAVSGLFQMPADGSSWMPESGQSAHLPTLCGGKAPEHRLMAHRSWLMPRGGRLRRSKPAWRARSARCFRPRFWDGNRTAFSSWTGIRQACFRPPPCPRDRIGVAEGMTRKMIAAAGEGKGKVSKSRRNLRADDGQPDKSAHLW